MSRVHALLLAGALLSGALVLQGRHTHPEQAHLYGRFTAQQILDRSEPLCRLLAPRANRLTLMAEPTAQGVAYPCWIIECTDPTGQKLAYLSWDATTGQLFCASRASQRSVPRVGSPLNRHEAVRAAWQWLRDLGMAAQASRWRLVGAPRYNGAIWRPTWTVSWSAPDLRATVHVYVLTHELVSARCSGIALSGSADLMR